MISKFKQLFFFLCWLSGIPYLLRQYYQASRATVLLFHHLDTSISKAAFDYFNKHYSIISCDTLYQALNTNQLNTLPTRSMLITFDDGRRTNLTLDTTSFEVKPVNFISTDISRLDGEKFISPKEITTLAKNFDIQAHTHTHPDLTQLTPNQIAFEISHNQQQLEAYLQKKPDYFAYPFGSFNQAAINAVKKSQYRAAFTTVPGFVSASDGLFKIKRICISESPSIFELSVRASGMHHLLLNIFKRHK